jgi:hypothetical protein
MDAGEWTLLLVLSASIVPAVEAMKLVQRALTRGAKAESWLGPMSRKG